MIDDWHTEYWRRTEVPGPAPTVTVVYSSPRTTWCYPVNSLLYDERMRDSIRRTAASRRLPAIEGRVTVTFKSEDEQGGQPVGPVTIFDHALYDADPEVIACRERGGIGVPFGYTPAGQHGLGWHKLAYARKVAKHYGVTLEEH